MGTPYFEKIVFDWYSCSFMRYPLSCRNLSKTIIPLGFLGVKMTNPWLLADPAKGSLFRWLTDGELQCDFSGELIIIFSSEERRQACIGTEIIGALS
jgi:hypothetical protein